MLRQFVRLLTRNVESKVVAVRSVSSTNQLFKEKDAVAAEKVGPPVEPGIIVEKDKNITTIGINRPQQRNAINARTASELCEAFSKFEADDTSPVAVLYGVGGSFCAGYDIHALGTDAGAQVSIDILMTQEGSVGPTRRHLKKPVICAVNGYCVANGMELALMCDLRVVEETAVMGFFNRRFGVPVIDGGTVRLPAMVGLSRALDLILTGRQLCADEACQMGIANRVVPTGTSLIHALELAHTLAKFPQSALRHDRHSLYSAVFEAANFGQAIQNEIMYTSKDIIQQMQDGIKWFNTTFKSGATHAWLKREKSMADWDDEQVAEAAGKIEEAKQKEEVKRIEAEKQKNLEAEQPKKTEKEKK